MKQFAASEMARAHRAVESAETLVEKDPDSAASRAYYAAYHAVTALFALRNRTFTKHTAIRAAVHRDLVKTGEWEEGRGKDYDFLLELRETADYGGMTHVTRDAAQSAIECSHRVLAAVRASCPELTPDLPEV